MAAFSKQPSADDFETILSFNMMVPPKVRVLALVGLPARRQRNYVET